MKLGRIIRSERIAKNMTIEQLSAASEVHVNTIKGLETGKRLACVRTLIKLVRALQLELAINDNKVEGISYTIDG